MVKILDVPFGKFRDKGQPIDNLSNYDSSQEELVYLMNLESLKEKKVLFGTKQGMLKVVDGSEFDVSKRTTAATKLGEEDEVLTVYALEDGDTLVMQSEKDYFLRIDPAEIPQKKKGAIGVRGIRLGAADVLTAIHVLNQGENSSVMVGEKEIVLNRLRIGKRDTKGVKK